LSEKMSESGMQRIEVARCIGSFSYASLAPVFMTSRIPSMSGKPPQECASAGAGMRGGGFASAASLSGMAGAGGGAGSKAPRCNLMAP
jgi:hypothetical protein